MERKTVAVIFGSVSSEYEVSLRSATSVLQNIPRDKYDVVMLGITKDGRWLEYTGELEPLIPDKWQQMGTVKPAIISPDRSVGGIFYPETGEKRRVDVIFPVLHGEHGEDGTIQGLFEMAGIPYVGCGVLASSTCMDKQTTHILLEAAGIRTAPYVTVTRDQLECIGSIEPDIANKLGYPMYVKPANTGSSVGVSKVRERSELLPALELAFKYDRKVLIETTIVGAEVECAVLGNYGDCVASVIGEIVPKHDFYDYEGKYLDDSTDLYIPARLPEAQTKKLQETAVKAFAALGCTGLSRVDFFAEKDGGIVLNEINTIPGFTTISMYPKLFEATGVPYPELIDRLLMLAMEKASL